MDPYLRSGALANRDDAVLFRVQNATLFSHRFGISNGGAEVTVPIQPTVKTGPLTIPVSGVGQAPRNERVGLIVAFDFPTRFSCDEGHLNRSE